MCPVTYITAQLDLCCISPDKGMHTQQQSGPPRLVHNANPSHMLLLEHTGQHLLACIVTPTACNTPTDVWVPAAM